MARPVITRLVLFGATGDLAGRFLFPALAWAIEAGELPRDLAVVGAAPQDWDDETFAAHVARGLAAHAGGVSGEVRAALLDGLRYRRVDFRDAATVARAVAAVTGPDRTGDRAGAAAAVAVYLAIPPTLFPAAVSALATADLPPGSRIAIEKPFGSDLAGAIALNALLAEVSGRATGAVFRVDHALAMPGVQELETWRKAALDRAAWGSGAYEQVDVLWEETLALEGRADFFDHTGAVRDVVQNHLLQLLALVAMEPPPTTAADDLHRVKLDLLRAVRVHSSGDAASQTSRARYTAGALADGSGTVPDYTREPGVDPDRHTETWAELRLEIDQPRWVGTTFVLRAGKALSTDRKGVVLHPRGHRPADTPGGGITPPTTAVAAAVAPAVAPSVTSSVTEQDPVWIGLDGSSSAAGVPGELAAYRRVLVDVLSGGSLLSVSGAEAEATWRIVEPVLHAWAGGAPPLLEYRAGSNNPAPPRP